MLLFELTVNLTGLQFYLRNIFLVKIRYSDRKRFDCDENIMAAVNLIENKVYMFQPKVKKRQFTLIGMRKK
jgi:hypothetical protein